MSLDDTIGVTSGGGPSTFKKVSPDAHEANVRFMRFMLAFRAAFAEGERRQHLRIGRRTARELELSQ